MFGQKSSARKKRGPYKKQKICSTNDAANSTTSVKEDALTCHEDNGFEQEETAFVMTQNTENINYGCEPEETASVMAQNMENYCEHEETAIVEQKIPELVSDDETKINVERTPPFHQSNCAEGQNTCQYKTEADGGCISKITIDETPSIIYDESPLLIRLNQVEVNFQYDEQENEDDVDLEQMEHMQSDEKEYADEEVAAVLTDPVFIVDDAIPEVLKAQQNIKADCDLNQPLHSVCSKSLGFIMLMICSLSIRFKLSDAALSYIITMINLIIPAESNMVKSVYALKEYLKKFVSFPTIHYLCSACGIHVTKDAMTCVNRHCRQDLSLPGSVGYFIQHSVIEQLKLMSKRKSFLQMVRSHRFVHYSKNTDNNLSDIYDGSNYRSLYENGFLKNPNSVSFSLNTDGVQVFKSSSISMWPVYMIINELPPTERKLKENIVYYGLWIASKKPMMWSYLKPLHKELLILEEGVEMEDNIGQSFLMKATLLNCVCDLPARCLVSNSIQFNGKFGCWFCLQPGETFTTNKGGHVHIFPFQKNDPKGPARTVQNLQDDVNEVVKKIQANEKNYMVRGIKGPFWFMFLKHFNVIHGFVIDYMHCVCAGIMKLLLTLWFDKQYKNEQFSVFSRKETVSSRLKQINPTINITRPPRSLDDLSHWKSAEYRNFLFLWSLPVLNGVLTDEYYKHFSLLARGIYNLSRESISLDELQNAEKCLYYFVENFALMYSPRFMTMNCHQLLHITDCVRANGPLFANNCFVFEDLNGYILKHIHGTAGIETQIINSVTKMQDVPTLKELHVVEGSDDDCLIDEIMRPNYLGNQRVVENDIFLLGQTFKRTLDDTEYSAVSDFLNICSPEIVVTEFRKIFVKRMSSAVYGSSYGRLQKRNQSIIKFYNSVGSVQFGNVKTFIQIQDHCRTISNIALVHPFASLLPISHQKSSHKIATQFKSIVAVPLYRILKVCSLVNIEENSFIVEFPNRFEKD